MEVCIVDKQKPIGMADVCNIFAQRHKRSAEALADEYRTTVETIKNIWARRTHRYWSNVQLRREYYSPSYRTVVEYRGSGTISHSTGGSKKEVRVLNPGDAWE